MPTATRKRTARRKTKRPARPKSRYWSGEVTRNSNALDLDSKVFTRGSARQVALSLKRSAERSTRRKASPYQSAMSMLTFYINRAGKGLPQRQRQVLQRAKTELRKVFGRA
jgi:Protein of unknown function (DUF3175)